jgi:hypothetical protein
MALSRHGCVAATAAMETELVLCGGAATPRGQGDKIMELGIYSFADVQRDPNSGALGVKRVRGKE